MNKELENYVKVTYIFQVPFPDQHNYWACLMKKRMTGEYYHIPIKIVEAESFSCVNGKVWQEELLSKKE